MGEILKSISELLKTFIELFNSLPENLKRFVIIPVLAGFMLGLSRALYSIVYPTTFRLNFRAQKRRDRIEYIVKMLERQAMLEDTNIAVLREELNRLVFEDVSGIAAKPLKRGGLRDLYDAAPSNFRWPLIKAAYNSLAERSGKLAKGVSTSDLIFGMAFGSLGVVMMLGGLFLFLYSFALRSQLGARLALFGAIVGLLVTLLFGVLTGMHAIPVLWAWQLQKWIPEKSKTENNESL